MNEKQMLFAYDRRRTSTLTVDEQPGAHTGATRKYIPGYSSSNIVYLDTATGNDTYDGTVPVYTSGTTGPVLTYAQAATLAGSTKKIRLVNSTTLSTNITKPTESTIGTSSTIASSLTAPVDTWTQAGTPSFSTTTIEAVAYSPKLNIYVAVGQSGKVATSPDGNTWTQQTAIFSAAQVLDVVWAQSAELFFACGNNGSFAYSSDGITWTQSVITEINISGSSSNINAVLWSDDLDIVLCASNSGTIAYSLDHGLTWAKANFVLSGQSYLGGCWASDLGKFFLCAGNGNIYFSEDASNWTAAATPSFGGDQIYWVVYSKEQAKLVAVGGAFATPKIAYSTDGDTWTQAGTVALSGARANYVDYAPEINKYVAVGNGGQIAYSTDGDTWTLAGTPSFSATSISDVCWSPLQGKFIAVGASGKIAYSTAYASTISAHVAGFTIQAMQYSGTITAYNCTFRQPGTTAALTLDACRVEYDSHISNNAVTSRATLYRGDRHLTCTPAAQNAIDLNLDTWGGAFYIYNASQTGFERIRDCIGAGPIVANYPVTVNGRANIEGSLVNVLTGAEVSFNDVSFVDTTDYKLEFQTNGYSRNSFAAGRSNLYFNSAGDARDIGAWSYVESAVSYYFAKSEPIYKGEIQHGLDFQLNEQQGDSGVVSVYGNTRRVKEVVTITYGTTYQREKDIFEYMLTLTDKTVKIQIDPEWDSNPGSVVVNGNQSAGSEFLTVDSTAYYEGMWLTIAGKQYWVMRAAPSPSAATKLILDRSLEDAVTDNDVITRNYPAGSGEYQFSGPTGLTLKRVDPTTLRGYYTGFQIRLVRKKQ